MRPDTRVVFKSFGAALRRCAGLARAIHLDGGISHVRYSIDPFDVSPAGDISSWCVCCRAFGRVRVVNHNDDV